MLQKSLHVERFGEKGEKTGWYYLFFDPADATLLLPGERRSFRVKGTLNKQPISQQALIPMGDGTFIMALNADLRRTLGLRLGDRVQVSLQHDPSEQQISKDLEVCLADDPAAAAFFYNLPRSHQMYFSRWIDGAKTEPTRAKRIAMTVQAAAAKQGYAEMIRAQKENRE